jgi:hypothetical protein
MIDRRRVRGEIDTFGKARNDNDPASARSRASWDARLWRSALALRAPTYIAAQRAAGSISVIAPQGCREFLVVLTRQPVSNRVFTSKEALTALDEWRRACTLLPENAATLAECLALVDRHDVKGKQVHDCNLVAVMNVHGVPRVATRNPNDVHRYAIQIDAVTP